MGKIIEETIGIALMLLTLLDIFLMIMYARANQTIFGSHLAHISWRAFVKASKLMGRWQEIFLSMTGPVILALTWPPGRCCSARPQH